MHLVYDSDLDWVVALTFSVDVVTGPTTVVKFPFSALTKGSTWTMPDVPGVCAEGELLFKNTRNAFCVWTAPTAKSPAAAEKMIVISGPTANAIRHVGDDIYINMLKVRRPLSDEAEQTFLFPLKKARQSGWVSESIEWWQRRWSKTRILFGSSLLVRVQFEHVLQMQEGDMLVTLRPAYRCDYCWGETAGKVCTGCYNTFYCDVGCQERHYSEHMKDCL